MPTSDEVRQLFRNAIGQVCRGGETLTPDEIREHCQSSLESSEARYLTLEVTYVGNEVRVARVALLTPIDDQSGSRVDINDLIDATTKVLRSALPPGSIADFRTDFDARNGTTICQVAALVRPLTSTE